ncbi:hypothetical protein MACH01_09880 [Thalassospira tepidiphila]|nr:hypothetical protein MACH01_09880 [Thalassospira tepidiphila]
MPPNEKRREKLPDGLVRLVSNDTRQIVATKSMKAAYDLIKRKKPQCSGTLKVTFSRWLDGFNLTPNQFKAEGTHKIGGKSVSLYAMKAKEVRFYGAELVIGGVLSFVLTEVELNKQKNKADPQKLKNAVKRLFPFIA